MVRLPPGGSVEDISGRVVVGGCGVGGRHAERGEERAPSVKFALGLGSEVPLARQPAREKEPRRGEGMFFHPGVFLSPRRCRKKLSTSREEEDWVKSACCVRWAALKVRAKRESERVVRLSVFLSEEERRGYRGQREPGDAARTLRALARLEPEAAEGGRRFSSPKKKHLGKYSKTSFLQEVVLKKRS